MDKSVPPTATKSTIGGISEGNARVEPGAGETVMLSVAVEAVYKSIYSENHLTSRLKREQNKIFPTWRTRMQPVPVIRNQNAYNCGTYSLWMALESLQGRNDALINRIEDAAKMWSDSMGGLFNPIHMERIIEWLNFRCKKVRFHDQQSFLIANQNHNQHAILIAYSYDMLMGIPVNGEPGDSSHWSVLTAINGANATLANPHGIQNQIPLADLIAANLALQASTFNWRRFVQQNQNDSSLIRS